jgi:uncharacterized RDD family membrane protein YckC
MTKFCPYCGKQLNERSKFCSQCGKASPGRERQAAVAVDEARDVSARAPRSIERAAAAEITGSEARTRVTGKDRNGSPVVIQKSGRRYAPPTYALIGAYESAGFGLRYGAWMFDFLITLIAMMMFTFIVTAVSHSSVLGSNTQLVMVALLTVLLFVLNFVVLAGSNGQSAGMRILGIYIVREDGRPFTIKDAAMRHLVGYPLSTLAFFLGFLWMLWDPRQQGWHDKIARTLVVMSK